MGGPVTFIVRLTDGQGQPVPDGQVDIALQDSSGKLVAELPAVFGSGDAYRSVAWTVPHRTTEGTWSIAIAFALEDEQ
jgi:hypothetical protein